MMKKIIIGILSLFVNVFAYGQTELSMFQLVKQPTEAYTLNTSTIVDSVGTIGDVFGDSINVSGYCVITDSVDVHSIHLNIGNQPDGSFNIYSDSLEYGLIPSVDSSGVYRQGSVLFLNFGTYLSTDTLYGEAWMYRLDGTSSAVIYYPLFD